MSTKKPLPTAHPKNPFGKLITHVLHESGTLAITVEEAGEGTFLILIDPAKTQPMACAVTVTLADRARCDVTVLHGPSSVVDCTIDEQSVLGAEAKIFWRNVTLGRGTVTHNLRSEIRGGGSESTVDWIFFASDHDRHSLSVRNVFLGSHGRGEIMMKGVAEDTAHVAARGMIEIGPKGEGTDTYLTQDVLMLDPTAKIDAIPGLEIKTNDVKASHSASVTRVTPEDLFYLSSRGISEAEARNMYVQGFLSDRTQQIPNKEVRSRVMDALEMKYLRP